MSTCSSKEWSPVIYVPCYVIINPIYKHEQMTHKPHTILAIADHVNNHIAVTFNRRLLKSPFMS